MKCLILGNGLIGSAIAEAMRERHHSVLVFDRDPSKTEVHAEELKFAFECAEYVISVVPTPVDLENGGFYLHHLEDTISLFKQYATPYATFIQRSTTMPGDAERLAIKYDILDRYVMSPSFAYRKSAPLNETHPDKVVFGGASFSVLKRVYFDLYAPVSFSRVFFGSLAEAELSKLASNLWQGLILSAHNEINQAYKDCDSDFVMETLIQEHNLHSIKRFHGKAFGRGGRLNDDMQAFASLQRGKPLHSVFIAAIELNDQLRELVGEENRPTAELEKEAFTGSVSAALRSQICQ